MDGLHNVDQNYMHRLATFNAFPVTSTVSTVELAKAGFEYKGTGDGVYCRDCFLTYANWRPQDKPFVIHQNLSPYCKLVQSLCLNTTPGATPSYDGLNRYPTLPTNEVPSHHQYSHVPISGNIESGLYNGVPNRDTYRDVPDRSIDTAYALVSHGPVCQPSDEGNHRPVLEPNALHHSEPNHMPIYNGHNNSLQSHDRYRETHNSFQHGNPNIPMVINSESHSNSNNSPLHSNINNSPLHSNINNSTLYGNNISPNHINHTPVNPLQQQRPLPVAERSNPNSHLGNRPTENNGSQRINNRPVMITTNNEALQYLEQGGQDEDWFMPRSTVGGNSNHSGQAGADYTRKADRLQSYTGRWSANHFLHPEELAEAGLYFTGPGDRVQCAWCRGGLLNWERGDTALGEHQNHFPECMYVRQQIASLLSGRRVVLPEPFHNAQDEILRTQLNQTPRQLPQSVTEPQSRPTNVQYPAVSMAQSMGYNMDIITQALQAITLTGNEVNSDRLLDKIFEIEEQVQSQAEASNVNQASASSRSVRNHPEAVSNGFHPDLSLVSSDFGSDATQISQRVRQLKEENLRLKGATLCKVCMYRDVCVLLLPCKHLVCCEECKIKLTHCPYCRGYISGTMKTYIP